MIHGLFFDERTWKIDYKTSPFWMPEHHGVQIELYPKFTDILSRDVSKKYKFVLTTDIWMPVMQKVLHYLRLQGLKILFCPREIVPTEAHNVNIFHEPAHKWNGQYLFTPDVLLAPGENYKNLWKNHSYAVVVGYPRYDIYLKRKLIRTNKQIKKRHGIEMDKKIVYFASGPPYHLKIVDGKTSYADFTNDFHSTLKVLEQYALSHPEVQVISKLHPYSQKMYDKNRGRGTEVTGILERYYKKPTNYMKVIGDNRTDSSASREMIMVADLVISGPSTTLMEGMMNDKSVIFVKFPQLQKIKHVIRYDEVVPTATSPQKLEHLIDRGLNNDDLKVKDKSLMEYYIYKIDGKFCERVCNEIRKVVNK